MRNEILQSVRDYIRQPFAFPYVYPKTLVMHDGETLCPACARNEYRLISASTRHQLRDGWQAAGVQIHYEGAPLYCAHCNAETESAYGDPDDENGAN